MTHRTDTVISADWQTYQYSDLTVGIWSTEDDRREKLT